MDISALYLGGSDGGDNDCDNEGVIITHALLSPAEDQHFRRHLVSSLNADVIIRQLPSEGLSFQLWPAATTVFSLLDTGRLQPFLRRGNRRLRVLELGSGTGLVGIAAAAVLGADVTVTDLGHVIPNLNYNVAVNADLVVSGGGTVVAAELGWGNVAQMEVIGREYDVIIGSDVVYHDHLYEPLLDTLKYFLLGGGGGGGGEEMVFLMAHLKRWKKEAAFFKKARKVFEVDVIHRDIPEDGKRVGVTVYRFVARTQTCSKRRSMVNGCRSPLSGLDSSCSSTASSEIGDIPVAL